MGGRKETGGRKTNSEQETGAREGARRGHERTDLFYFLRSLSISSVSLPSAKFPAPENPGPAC